MTLETHLRLVGVLLLLLAGLNVLMPKHFGWREEFARLTLLTRQVFIVHAMFIFLILVLLAALVLLAPEQLVERSALARSLLIGLVVFWGFRLFVQWFVYDRSLWRGIPVRTGLHFAFTGLWAYFTGVFGWAAVPATVAATDSTAFGNMSRVIYASFAVVGTLAYAESFRAIGVSVGAAAAAIGLAAGASWIGFGAVLVLCTRRRVAVMAWFDACLRTMVIGNLMLLASCVLNTLVSVALFPPLAAYPGFYGLHATVLMAADALMCRCFKAEARQLGVGAGLALLFWFGGLHGFFIAGLWVLWPGGMR